MSYFVYILKCADGTLYTGSTNDLKKRLSSHNFSDTGAKYTRSRRPVKLIYSEEFANQSEALKREYKVKQMTRVQKKALIKIAQNRAR